MYNPLVSIIMATHNRGNIIGKAIQSVIDQTYQNWELIIVMDGCEDDTEDVIGEFEDKRIKHFNEPKFIYYTDVRNFGINKSKGELLAYCDDDNIMHPEFLEELVKPHETEDVILTYCGRKDYRSVNLETLDIKSIDKIPPTIKPPYVLHTGKESLSGWIDVGDMVHKRSVFKEDFNGFRSGEVELDFPSYCSDAKLIDDIERHNRQGKFILVRKRLSYYFLVHGGDQMTLRKIEGREKGELVDEQEWTF